MKKAVFEIIGMNCTSCALNIDFYLEELEGIIKTETKFAASTTTVAYDPEKINISKVINAIKKSGYTAKLKI